MKQKAAHTPAPWIADLGEAYRVRAQQDGGQVAIMTWTGRRRDARDVGSDVHGLLIVPAGTLGMGMGGGCSEKDNVACA